MEGGCHQPGAAPSAGTRPAAACGAGAAGGLGAAKREGEAKEDQVGKPVTCSSMSSPLLPWRASWAGTLGVLAGATTATARPLPGKPLPSGARKGAGVARLPSGKRDAGPAEG